MAWVRIIDPERADGELAELYAGLPGEPDGIVQAHSLVPRALAALLTFYKGVMHGPLDLTMTERETIAVTVSHVNDCYY